MKAAIYSRKSVFTGKGDSIENQIQMCKDYCKYNLNINEFIIYEDEGFSGGNINRPKFKELLEDIKSKKFDFLICYRLDRISRNVADFSTTLELLQNHNISFISIKEQFDTSTPMGKAMVYIASVFAQLERETIAERVRDNMLELAKTGRWLGGQIPLGFKSENITYIDSELKERSISKLSPHTTELEVVKLIYNTYLKTKSINSVLKDLITNNIKGKNGGDFAYISILDILRNPVYVKSTKEVLNYLSEKKILVYGIPNNNGILTYNKRNSKYKTKDINEWIAAVSNHKGIIDANDWLEIQKNLDINSKKESKRQGTSKKALLSGILKCEKCNAPMRISYGRPKKNSSEKIYYYVCTRKANSNKMKCNNPNVRGDKLESAVIDNIKNLNIDVIIKELEKYVQEKTYKQNNYKNSFIKELIDEKEKDMNSLLNQLSKMNNTSVASEFILDKIDKLGNEIKNLRLQLEDLKIKNEINLENMMNPCTILDSLKKFNTFFNTLDKFNYENDEENIIIKKRYLLKFIIDEITWNGETNNINIYLWGSNNK